MAESLAVVAKGAVIPPIDLSGPLNSLAQAVSAHVDGTLAAVSRATTGLQRRTNLIWWKESLYSPSGRLSYRQMPTSTAAALMAFDLHQQVPTFSPASVAAFLHEAVLSLPSINPAEGRPIRDLLEEAVESPELTPLREAAAQLVQDSAGRGPILGPLGHNSGRSTLDDSEFRVRVGVPAATPLTVPEWRRGSSESCKPLAQRKRGRRRRSEDADPDDRVLATDVLRARKYLRLGLPGPRQVPGLGPRRGSGRAR